MESSECGYRISYLLGFFVFLTLSPEPHLSLEICKYRVRLTREKLLYTCNVARMLIELGFMEHTGCRTESDIVVHTGYGLSSLVSDLDCISLFLELYSTITNTEYTSQCTS